MKIASKTASAPLVTTAAEAQVVAANLRVELEQAKALVGDIEARLNDPVAGEDTEESLGKLQEALPRARLKRAELQAAYQRAVDTANNLEAVEFVEEKKRQRSSLTARRDQAMGDVDKRYTVPLNAVLKYVAELAALRADIRSYNELRPVGEERLPDFEQLVRVTPATPDQTIEMPVEHRVPPGGKMPAVSQPGDSSSWPLKKIIEKQIV